jgi:outer membrane protein TolC
MTAPTRDHILDAALRLYGEHGFRGTTTRRIAQEAGVNEVTLFRLFGSKTALLLEALRVHGAEPVRAELPAVPVDPLTELTEWCTHKRRAISSMRSTIRKAMSEFEENPDMPKCITQGAHTTYASLREYLERLADAGFTNGAHDVAPAASMLISTVFHDAIARDMMPHAFPVPSSAAPATYARLCLKSLGCDAAAHKGRRHGHAGTRRRTLLAGAALLLAGVGPPLRAQQATAVSLEDALRIGARISHTVKTAEAGVLRAQGGQYQARSQYLPQLNGSLSYQRILQSQFAAIANSADTTSKSGSGSSGGSGSSSSGTTEISALSKIFAAPNTMILGVTLTQNLFTAGRASSAVQGARAARTSAEIALDAARAQVSLDVAQAYFDAVASDKLVEIEDSTLAEAERTLQQTTVSQQVGAAAEFDLLRARVARDNQRPVVIQAQSNRDIALLRLRQLLGIPLAERIALTTAIRDDGVADSVVAPLQLNQPITIPGANRGLVPDTSVSSRSSVRQAEANITAQQYALRAARWERLPSAQVSSTYQRYGYPADANFAGNVFGTYYPNWTVSFGLSLPLFTGGKLTGDRMVAEANVAEARQSLEQVKELAALDARTALAQLDEAGASYAASVGTDTQAARAYSIAEVRFQQGISTQVELEQSRTQYEQARLNRVLAARDLEVARLRMALLKDLPVASATAGTSGTTSGTTPSAPVNP